MNKFKLWHNLRKIIFFLRPDYGDFLIIFGYALANGVLLLVVPLAASALVSKIAFGQLFQPLVVLSFFVFFGLIGVALFRFFQVQLVELIQQRIFARVAVRLIKKLPSIEFAYWRNFYAPEMMNRFLEVVAIQKITARLLMEGVGVFFQIIISLLLISLYHPLFLVFGIFLAFSILLVLLLGVGGIKTAYLESECKYEILHWLEEVTRIPILFKDYAGKAFAYQRADLLITSYLMARKSHFKVLTRHYVGSYMVNALAGAGILLLGGWLVMKDELTLGQLVSAEIVISATIYSTAKFGKTLEAFYDLVVATAKLDELMLIPRESDQGELEYKKNGPIEVSFNDVILFSGTERQARIDFEVKAGSKIAIFGRNGSGKSALANMIYKLDRPSSGVIRINGINIKEIEMNSLRSSIQLIRGRDFIVGTIEENVSLLNPDIEIGEVLKVLNDVGLLSLVEKLEDGIKTKLSSSGAPLSTGQIAQLVVARAIVNKPDLIIIDEALDAIDSNNLKNIYELILSESAPWTLIDLTSDVLIWDYFQEHYRLSIDGITRHVKDIQKG